MFDEIDLKGVPPSKATEQVIESLLSILALNKPSLKILFAPGKKNIPVKSGVIAELGKYVKQGIPAYSLETNGFSSLLLGIILALK